MALTIDGPNKQLVISVDTTFSFHDIYVAVMDWSALSGNMQYLIPLSSSGNAPLGGGLFTDIIYVIENGWKIKPSGYTSGTQISIVGTLITSDGSNPTTPPTTGGVPQFLFKVATNGIISTSGGGGGGLTSPQDAKLTSIYDTVILNLDAKVSEVVGGGGGLTEAESKHLMKLRNGGGGGAIIDGKSIEDFLKKGNAPLVKTIEKLPEEIKTKLDEKISEENNLAEEKLSDIIESKDQEIEKVLGLVNTLSEKTESALKGFSEIVKTGKENTEKLLHSIEVKELEKDIEKETDMLDKKVENTLQEEISSLDNALEEKIERETKELDEKFEKQIEDEIKILDSKLQ